MSTSTLDVPGATISYTTVGSGPLLLLIPGASGDGAVWRFITQALVPTFTVCSYARRGFKESVLQEPQDYTPHIRLARDADDAAALIGAISPSRPAYVLGTSSGGIVALELLRRHPDIIHALICHEPPLTKALDDGEAAQVHGIYTGVYDIYRSQGINVAVDHFVGHVGRQAEVDMMRQSMQHPHNQREVEYWLEHELRQYTAIEPDFETLRSHNSRLVFVHGRESVGTSLQRIAQNMAKATGAQLRMAPGGHVAYVTHSQAFAEAVIKILLPTPAFMWPMFVP